MKNIWMKLLLLAFILFVVINVYTLITHKKGDPHSNPGQAHTHGALILPNFTVSNSLGETIQTDTLLGKRSYVQFLDWRDNEGIDLFREVHQRFKAEDLSMVIFTEDVKRLLQHISIDEKRVHLIGEKYEEMLRTFRTAPNVGAYFIYDVDGSGKSAGFSRNGFENGPKLILNQLFYDEYFDITGFIPQDDIQDAPWLAQVQQLTSNGDGDIFMAALFNQWCDQCGTGPILSTMKKLQTRFPQKLGLFIISYQNFSQSDREALLSQMGVNFPVVVADEALREKWDQMMQRFNTVILDNIVILLDKTGKIHFTLHPTCRCFRSFFEKADTLLTEDVQ